MTTRTLRLAIADDHMLFREGLRSLLDVEHGVVVAAETDRVDQIEPMLSTTPCDILLLDVHMDRSSLADIGRLATLVKVIVVTASEDPAHAVRAIRSGACAVVLKRFAAETLRGAIEAVANGRTWVAPASPSVAGGQSAEPSPQLLTPREQEIVRHVAHGLCSAEIGTRLLITGQTVKAHLGNIFRKLRVRDRVQLMLYAIRTGIAGIDEE